MNIKKVGGVLVIMVDKVNTQRGDDKLELHLHEVEESTIDIVLLMTVRGPEGMPHSLTDDIANEIIKKFKLTLTDDWDKAGGGIISGEIGATFRYEGEILRLKKTWMRRWKLYRGKWKSDPHWRGD